MKQYQQTVPHPEVLAFPSTDACKIISELHKQIFSQIKEVMDDENLSRAQVKQLLTNIALGHRMASILREED